MGHQGPNPQLQQRRHIPLSLSQYQHLQVAHQSNLSDTRNYIAYTKKKKKFQVNDACLYNMLN